LHLRRLADALGQRGLALEIGMLAELDENDGAKALLGKARRQDRDRPGDVAFGAKTPQPAGDGRWRKRHARSEGFRGLGIVALHLVQESDVEAVEHCGQAAKIWQAVQQKCARTAPPFAEIWHRGRRICTKSDAEPE
jgi:hypothetical protein